MTPSPAALAFSDLVVLVFRLNGALLRAGDALSAPAGQTSARWQVMGVVDVEALSVAEVARRMGLARQSVQRTADLLVGDGLAAYEDNPGHRRAKLLRLTPRGRAALDVIESAQAAWANRVAGAIPEPDLRRAADVLTALLAALGDAGPTDEG